MTDPLGQAQVLPYLLGLAKLGYNITVLSVEKKERMEREKGVVSKLMVEGGLSWYPLLFHHRLPLLSKIYDRFQLRKAALKICRKQKIDLVHCRSYVAAEIGLFLQKKLGVPFIFDMRGFWADEKRDSGHWNTNHPVYRGIYKYYKALEKKLLIHANMVVVLTHAAKDEIIYWSLGKGVNQKIHVIPCCADMEHFSEQNVDLELKAKLTKELELRNSSPVLCYLGSIGEAYAIDEMLYFFNQLKSRYPTAKFLFLTKDAPVLVLNRLHDFPQIASTDIIIRFASRKEVPTYLSLCNFSLFFYKPTYSRIGCSPTKFAEVSGLGLPVICNAVGDLNQQYLEGLPHRVLDNLDKVTIANSVAAIDHLQRADKSAIRDFALKQFNLEDGVKRYNLIYESIIQ